MPAVDDGAIPILTNVTIDQLVFIFYGVTCGVPYWTVQTPKPFEVSQILN